MKNWVIVFLYLAAIVIANLSVTHFGKWALPFTAFILIPFDLVARDVLHERWASNSILGLYYRLGALICGGALLSFLINQDAKNVAIASCVTFFAVGLVNTLVYQALRSHVTRIARMNISNAVAAFVDSALFPLIALGIFEYQLFFSQSGSKIVGGIVWAYIFVKGIEKWKST